MGAGRKSHGGGRRTMALLVVGALFAGLAVLSAAPPATADVGDLDPRFGGGDGIVSYDSGHGPKPFLAERLGIQPDGRSIVTIYGGAVQRFETTGASDSTWNSGEPQLDRAATEMEVDGLGRTYAATNDTLSRLTADGALDSSFGDGGVVALDVLTDAGDFFVQGIAPAADGGVLVAGRSGSPWRAMLLRLDPAGALDQSFSGDGRVEFPATVNEVNELSVGSDGTWYVAATAYGPPRHVVAKVLASGDLAAGFGAGGLAAIALEGNVLGLHVDGSGRAVVLTTALAPTRLRAVRVTASGALDASYGTDGVETIDPPGVRNPGVAAVGANGIAYVAMCTCVTGEPDGASIVAVDLGTGALAPDFSTGGADGSGIRTFTGPDPLLFNAIEVTPTGMIRVGLRTLPLYRSRSAELVQLMPTGDLDPEFGDEGRHPLVFPGHGGGGLLTLATLDDGSVLATGLINREPSVFRLTESGAPLPGFGDEGRAVLPLPDGVEQLYTLAATHLSGGRIAVLARLSGPAFSPAPTAVIVLGADGAPDLSFGDAGFAEVGLVDDNPGWRVNPVSMTSAGTGASEGILVIGPDVTAGGVYGSSFIQRLSLDGVIDEVYGASDGSDDGWRAVDVPPPVGIGSDERVIAGSPDGSVAWGAVAGEDDALGVAVGRLNADGSTDLTFGEAGVRLVLSESNVAAGVLHLARRPDGGADLLGWNEEETSNEYPVAIRVDGGGDLDETYGDAGVGRIRDDRLAFHPAGAAARGDRAIFTVNLQSEELGLRVGFARLTADGQPDPDFGPTGITDVDAPPDPPGWQPVAGTDDGFLYESTRLVRHPGELPGRDAEIRSALASPDLPTVPTPPTAVTAEAGHGRATVSWGPPSTLGESAISSYLVTASPGGATCATTGATSCTVTGLTNGQAYTFTMTATNATGASAPSAASSPVTPTVGFAPLPSPKRIADSRSTGDTDDDQQKGFGALATGTTRAIPVAGRVGVPAGAHSAVLSVAAVGPTGTGYLTVYPCGTPRPATSNLNFTTGVTLANTVITKLGTTGPDAGKVCVYAGKTTHVLIDVTGSLR